VLPAQKWSELAVNTFVAWEVSPGGKYRQSCSRAALREAEVGNASQAKQGVAAALALAPGRDVKVLAAMALARVGDVARAKSLAEELAAVRSDSKETAALWQVNARRAVDSEF
jgi:hypothetical protein